MPQNNRLQFSVEESICFQKGQEVSELLSISLDPDITVQEVNDYVSIRGSLELTGEYNIDQTYTECHFSRQLQKFLFPNGLLCGRIPGRIQESAVSMFRVRLSWQAGCRTACRPDSPQSRPFGKRNF